MELGSAEWTGVGPFKCASASASPSKEKSATRAARRVRRVCWATIQRPLARWEGGCLPCAPRGAGGLWFGQAGF